MELTLTSKLLPYQEEAVNKLKKYKVGALFMEQGTGKTITAMELCRLRLIQKKVNHILWLCPFNVREALKFEMLRHTSQEFLKYVTICGIESLSKSHSTAAYLMKLVEEKRCYLIVDESLMIKNPRAARTHRVVGLSEKCSYKLILNGTPISRHEADLFTQFYVLDWRILGYRNYWSFAANHIEFNEFVPFQVYRCLNTEYLAKKISPYTFQIRKDDCLVLPDKTYKKEYFNLTKGQMAHYYNIADEMFMNLDYIAPETIYRMLSALQSILSGFRITNTKGHLEKKAYFEDLNKNPRMKALMSCLTDSKKVIIFAVYQKEIADIVEVLKAEYGPAAVVKFDGTISFAERQRNLAYFEKKADFMVANRRCASFGLNLQFCNHIIFYSNDWNLATKIQSEDRIHRIGQNREILIQDICACHTIDERILKSLEKKEDMLRILQDKLKNMESVEEVKDWLYINRAGLQTPFDCSEMGEG